MPSLLAQAEQTLAQGARLSLRGVRGRLSSSMLGISCLVAMLALGISACAAPTSTTVPALGSPRSAVTLVRAQCIGTTRCVLGFVHAAESGAALPGAVVFLQSDSDSAMLVAKSDEQGVFQVQDPPAGRYRLSVFQRSRRFEVHGVEIGAAGTTLIPIRIAPI